jgi:hypothetical protein
MSPRNERQTALLSEINDFLARYDKMESLSQVTPIGSQTLRKVTIP